jgi:hypothetical protein
LLAQKLGIGFAGNHLLSGLAQIRSRRWFAASGRLSCNRFSTSTTRWISLIVAVTPPKQDIGNQIS